MRRNTFSSGTYEGPADQFKKKFYATLNDIIKHQNKPKGVVDKISSFMEFKAKNPIEKDPIITIAEALKEKAEKLFVTDSSSKKFIELLYDLLTDICILSNEVEKIAPYSTMVSFLKVDTVNDLLAVLGKFGYNLVDLNYHLIKMEREGTKEFFNEVIYKINRLSEKQSHIKTSHERLSSYAQMPFVSLGKNSISLAPIESSTDNKKIEDTHSTSSVENNSENVGKDAIQPNTKVGF